MAKRSKGDNTATLERPKANGRRSKRVNGQKGNADRNALPASVATGNPDRQREQSRRQLSDNRFRTNLSEEDRQKEAAKLSRVDRESSKANGDSPKHRAKTVDEFHDQQVPDPAPTSVIDHGIKNHGREEHNHVPAGANSHVEGPAPRRISKIQDDDLILETLRLETKADNLYLMRREEREADKPRDYVIDAINQRLKEVQGEPILDE